MSGDDLRALTPEQWLRNKLHKRHCEQCDVTRALLDRLEAAEAAVERVRGLADEWVKRDCEWSCESEMLDDLRAALDGPA